MWGAYLGHLPEGDPLYGYLRYEIFPKVGEHHAGRIRVFRMNGSHAVYLYEACGSNARVIGKFFGVDSDPVTAARRLEREYRNLLTFRSCGFTGGVHYVARPLGCRVDLNYLLVIEHCGGESLDRILLRLLRGECEARELYGKLTALAYFLATLHNRTALADCPVNFQEGTAYLEGLLNILNSQTLLDEAGRGAFLYRRDRWRERGEMWGDASVLVHGDATPSNFLFGDGLHVISFDLERVRRTDRVFDTGRVAGELMHFFLRATGNRAAAEPFIGHFLWEYACHFPDRDRAFQATTQRVPFYLGCTLLRIARNDYLDWEYRKRLVDEARRCFG